MKRIKYIDIAKAIAIFFIVFGHSIVHSLHCHILFKIIYSFHVPLFFIISGFTFSSDKKDYKNFIFNKFKRIIIPYLIWSILFLIPYYLFGKNIDSSFGNNGTFNIIDNLKNIFYGVGSSSMLKQNTPLWFLPALFTMEAIFFFICKEKKKQKQLSILSLFFIIGIISSIFLKIVLPFGINSFLNIGFFFYLGTYIKNNIDFKKIANNKWILLLVLTLGITIAVLNDSASCVDYYYGNILLFYISATLLSIFVIFISIIIDNNDILEYIGKNTLGILIFHKLIIVIFQNKLPVISKLLRDSNYALEPIIGIIISFITIGICIIIIKLFNLLHIEFMLGENKKLK